MKKILIILTLFCIFSLTGCSKSTDVKTTTDTEIMNDFITATLNNEDNIVIDTTNITSTATLINYEVDGVIIQIIVIRHTDGTIGVAFNSCEACNISPNGYFIQKGDYFECQNCGTRVSIDKIGIVAGECNPFPATEYKEEENTITLSKEYVESFKSYFEDWNGITSK